MGAADGVSGRVSAGTGLLGVRDGRATDKELGTEVGSAANSRIAILLT